MPASSSPLIYTRERAYELALAKLNKLAAGYPENYLVALDRAGIARRLGRPGFAIELRGGVLGKLQPRDDGFERLERSSVYNQIGLAWRDKGAFRAAENWFRLAIRELDVSPRTRTIAQLELAKTLDLARRRAEALPLYRAVATAADVAGSSEEAAEWVKRPYEAK
jgi:tetratricopeptide (TPR) repeat protein